MNMKIENKRVFEEISSLINCKLNFSDVQIFPQPLVVMDVKFVSLRYKIMDVA